MVEDPAHAIGRVSQAPGEGAWVGSEGQPYDCSILKWCVIATWDVKAAPGMIGRLEGLKK